MTGDIKKPQVALCLAAGVGMFLPLYKISAYNETARLTFMEVFDITSKEAGMSIINAKIVLGVLIVAFIAILIRFGKDDFWVKLVSLLLILAAGVLYYIDIDKIAAAKSILSSMMKYSYGHYITLISIVVAFLLGLLDIFTSHSTYKPMDDYTFNALRDRSANNVNAAYNMQNNNQVANNMVPNPNPMVPNNVAPPNQNIAPTNNIQPDSQIKLSDLVNHNQPSENQTNTNSIDK